MKWVTIRKAAELSGYSEKAIRAKRENGSWPEYLTSIKAPDGRILISTDGVDALVGGPRGRGIGGDPEVNRGSGVKASSAGSIEISFEYQGTRCRERIRLPPNHANLRYVRNLKVTIEAEIAVGKFDYAAHFPKSKRAQRTAAAAPAEC